MKRCVKIHVWGLYLSLFPLELANTTDDTNHTSFTNSIKLIPQKQSVTGSQSLFTSTAGTDMFVYGSEDLETMNPTIASNGGLNVVRSFEGWED
jgi:hypothetical protein